jgi:hypothetical protein
MLMANRQSTAPKNHRSPRPAKQPGAARHRG